MTQRTELERVLDVWLDEGPMAVPDRVFESTVAAVYRAPQRPSWRLRWRSLAMNRTARLAVVGLAILAIAGFGFVMFAGQPAPAPTTAPSPSAATSVATPSATRTPAPIACLVDGTPREACKGRLAAGTYVLRSPLVPFAVTVPDGWVNRMNILGGAMLEPDGSSDTVIYVWPDPVIAPQSCAPVAALAGGRRVVDIVEFLTTHPGVDVADRQKVVLGRLNGESMRLTTSSDSAPCSGRPSLFVHDTTITDGFNWDIGSGDVMQIWLLEAGDGHTVLVNAQADASEIDAFLAAATPIIESIVFTRQANCVDQSLCLGDLAPGTYTSYQLEVPLTYTLPEGWRNHFDTPLGFALQSASAADFATSGIFLFLDVYGSDQSSCVKRPADGLGRSSGDLIGWLGTLPDLSITPPQAASVGGLTGSVVDVTVSSGGPVCSPSEYKLWVSDYAPLWFGTELGTVQRTYLLDLPSRYNVLILVTAAEADFDAFAAEADAVVESFAFAP